MDDIKLISDKINKLSITKVEFPEICRLLGNENRVNIITTDGWQINNHFVKEGKVLTSVFCQWWINQDHFESLKSKLEENFHDVKILERHDSKLRWQIKKDNNLSTIFDKMEKIQKNKRRIIYFEIDSSNDTKLKF